MTQFNPMQFFIGASYRSYTFFTTFIRSSWEGCKKIVDVTFKTIFKLLAGRF